MGQRPIVDSVIMEGPPGYVTAKVNWTRFLCEANSIASDKKPKKLISLMGPTASGKKQN